MIPVATPTIGDVQLRRHILDREAAGLAKIAQRLGLRLRASLRQLADGVLPDGEWRETYRWYQDTVLGLLKEQRMRSTLKDGRPPLTDEEYNTELTALARETLHGMSRTEVEQLLKEGAIDVDASTAAPPSVDADAVDVIVDHVDQSSSPPETTTGGTLSETNANASTVTCSPDVTAIPAASPYDAGTEGGPEGHYRAPGSASSDEPTFPFDFGGES